MLWILSAIILSYAAFLALKLGRDLISERKELKEQSRQLDRRLEILERAAQKSRYSLPVIEDHQAEPSRVVKDLDRHG